MLLSRSVCSPLLFLGFTGLVFAGVALANQSKSSNFSVSPMVNILDLRNGQAKGVINVTNKDKDPLRVRIYSEDFTYDRSQGYVSSKSHAQSAINYLQFAPRELVVPPGVTRSIRVGATLPNNLPNGEYRASLFVENLNEQNISTTSSQQVSLKVRIASVFFFSKGSMKSELSMSGASWQSATKSLLMVLNNKGKKTSYPIVDWRLEKDGKVAIKDTLNGILLQSQNEREFQLQLQSANLSPGNYNFIGEIKEAGQKPIPFNIKVAIQ